MDIGWQLVDSITQNFAAYWTKSGIPPQECRLANKTRARTQWARDIINQQWSQGDHQGLASQMTNCILSKNSSESSAETCSALCTLATAESCVSANAAYRWRTPWVKFCRNPQAQVRSSIVHSNWSNSWNSSMFVAMLCFKDSLFSFYFSRHLQGSSTFNQSIFMSIFRWMGRKFEDLLASRFRSSKRLEGRWSLVLLPHRTSSGLSFRGGSKRGRGVWLLPQSRGKTNLGLMIKGSWNKQVDAYFGVTPMSDP